MRKNILFCSILIVIIGIVTFKNNPIYKIYRERQIINDNINFLNGISTNNICDYYITEYERIKMPIIDLNHYDITRMIDKYIELVLLGINNNGVGNNKRKNDSRISDMKNYTKKGYLEVGKDMLMKYDNNIQYYIVNDDKNYGKEELTSELKKIIEYQEKDGKIKWLINDTKEKIIELPFNCYLKYTPYKRENNVDFKKVESIIFNKNFDINSTGNSAIAKYITKNGVEKTIEITIEKFEDNDKIYYSCSPAKILVLNGDTLSELEFRNHNIDRLKEEHKKLVDELQNKFMHEEMEAGLR